MITGELKNKIDGIWDIFWSSGMTNAVIIKSRTMQFRGLSQLSMILSPLKRKSALTRQ